MKIKTLLYCTKATKKSDYLIKNYLDNYVLVNECLTNTKLALNGKIACECEVDTEEIKLIENEEQDMFFETNSMKGQTLDKRSCLKEYELDNYLNLYNHEIGDKCGYALHLSNVKERAMELSDVCKYDFWASKMFGISATEKDLYEPLEKAPQNMMWVWIKENGKWVQYLLISVRPQWLCKILNGEKDIEVRRKVLKGMCD